MQYEAPETMLLLMSCLDGILIFLFLFLFFEQILDLFFSINVGVVDPEDPSLRDFSADCVAEFLKWSIKQSRKKVKFKIDQDIFIKN